MTIPCGVWKSADVADADVGTVVGGYKSDGALRVEVVRQPDGLWSVTATFPPCGAAAPSGPTGEARATESVATKANSDLQPVSVAAMAAVQPTPATSARSVTTAVSLIGLDTPLDCTAHAATIAGSGVKIVGRYYRWPTSKFKSLGHDEAVALSKAGLSILALWEWTSDVIRNFSMNNGIDQGTSAANQALQAHQPPGTPIYFAVDFDASPEECCGGVADYFRGVRQAFNNLGAKYQIGVYGSGRTCSWLLGHGLADYAWLADAPGWGGSNAFHDWHVCQGHADLHIAGLKPGGTGDYDSNQVKQSAGFFRVEA